jgi:hypothetical protein
MSSPLADRLEREGVARRFGIKVTLPESDPMRAPHLLGEDWAYWRWYPTEEERDRAFDEMQSTPVYYRLGDRPSQVLTRVEEEE